jgi:hypothetical protein
MSIIHDALKKIQQGRLPKAEEKPAPPAAENPQAPSPSKNIFEPEPAAKPTELPAAAEAAAPENKTNVLALICAFLITAGICVFLFHQVTKYFPRVKNWAKAYYAKVFHVKETRRYTPQAAGNLGPLAKITVNPSSSSSSSASSGTDGHVTLNIHGVMSNGPKNLVLINDQVYQEGDDVEGVKIVKINLKSITIINNGQEETIPVGR